MVFFVRWRRILPRIIPSISIFFGSIFNYVHCHCRRHLSPLSFWLLLLLLLSLLFLVLLMVVFIITVAAAVAVLSAFFLRVVRRIYVFFCCSAVVRNVYYLISVHIHLANLFVVCAFYLFMNWNCIPVNEFIHLAWRILGKWRSDNVTPPKLMDHNEQTTRKSRSVALRREKKPVT